MRDLHGCILDRGKSTARTGLGASDVVGFERDRCSHRDRFLFDLLCIIIFRPNFHARRPASVLCKPSSPQVLVRYHPLHIPAPISITIHPTLVYYYYRSRLDDIRYGCLGHKPCQGAAFCARRTTTRVLTRRSVGSAQTDSTTLGTTARQARSPGYNYKSRYCYAPAAKELHSCTSKSS